MEMISELVFIKSMGYFPRQLHFKKYNYSIIKLFKVNNDQLKDYSNILMKIHTYKP
jgi:hypothetical protein